LAKTKTIDQYSLLLPVLVFAVFYKRIKSDRISVILVCYVAFSFLFNLSLQLEAINYKFHNQAYPVFTLIETLLFAWALLSLIKSEVWKNRLKWIVLAVIIGFIAYYFYFYIANYALYRKKLSLDSIPIGIETILILLFIAVYFREQISIVETNSFIYEKPHFWYILGILIYLAGSFFIYITASSLSVKEIQKYWVLTNLASIIKNILFAAALLLLATNSFKKKRRSFNLYPAN
jgi:hypothetical protein